MNEQKRVFVPKIDKQETVKQNAEVAAEITAPVRKNEGSLDDLKAGDQIETNLGISAAREKLGLKEKDEPIVNQEREKKFEKLMYYLSQVKEKFGEEVIRQLFCNMFNPMIEANGRQALDPKEISSLSYATLQVDKVSQIAGQEIKRPLWLFKNPEEYWSFTERLFGKKEGHARYISFPRLPEDHILKDIGFILSTEKSRMLTHEAMHSVDPHQIDRSKFDQIITESFAYYQNLLDEIDLHKLEVEKNPSLAQVKFYKDLDAKVWEFLPERVVNSLPELPREEAVEIGKRLARYLKEYAKKYDHIEAQRQLAKSKTLDEFFGNMQVAGINAG